MADMRSTLTGRPAWLPSTAYRADYSGAMSLPPQPVRVEVVCTANICRSPFVALLLGHHLDEVSPGEFDIRSSGTLALAGTPADGGSRRVARDRGLSLRDSRAVQTTPAALAESDLILVMDKNHRQTVIDEYPGAIRRTFLLKEFARLLGDLDAQQPWEARLGSLRDRSAWTRWRFLVRSCAAVREQWRAEDDELDDPFTHGLRAFEAMAREVDTAVATIVDVERRTR